MGLRIWPAGRVESEISSIVESSFSGPPGEVWVDWVACIILQKHRTPALFREGGRYNLAAWTHTVIAQSMERSHGQGLLRCLQKANAKTGTDVKDTY